ncbi:hypothetical protein [Deinococcus sp.]|uniref:hypothetical protein n=1 Tax=Deinococcus sp. TaxID=47478 RepID=UPI003B5A5B2A
MRRQTSRVFVLAAFAGFIAAVFSLLWWVLGALAAAFGYQSNDANLPITLVISAFIFAALLGLATSEPGQRLRRALRRE